MSCLNPSFVMVSSMNPSRTCKSIVHELLCMERRLIPILRNVKNYNSFIWDKEMMTLNDRASNLKLATAPDQAESPTLAALGERLRMLRSRRGLTRKSVALAADISERYLANLEYGQANPSILILEQLARALACSLAELLGDVTTSSPEWLLIRELLEGRN